MKVKEAQNFVNYLRKVRPNRKWPTPVEYIGGGVNGKVYLTNSGKLMKIGLGSNPQEFRPLHILRNTKFVPKFNQRNWAIVPIRSGRPRKYVKQVQSLFGMRNSKISKNTRKQLHNTRLKLKEFKNINKKVREGFKRKNVENYMKRLQNYINSKEPNYKKATVFLMNKINGSGSNVMTLKQFLKTFTGNKNIFRNSIVEMIKQIKLRGISHGNLHSENILVSTSKNGKIKLWMIDFGRSSVIPLGMTERNFFGKTKKMNFMFKSTGPLSKQYENRNVPVYNGSRANVHMANVHYGIPFTRNMENNIKRLRTASASK
jgi:hypothetical protein